jgi:hypothetical protein
MMQEESLQQVSSGSGIVKVKTTWFNVAVFFLS